jgi:DNA repair exonuclease SbcCD nuclease subunit
MRFIHTADWQIGMKAANVAEVADRVRAARLEAIDAIGRLAGEKGVDFVLVAGDVFEHNQVGHQCARDVLRRLGSYPVDVYIIPGNHDYAGAGSIYMTSAFQNPPFNVHVLLKREPIELGHLGAVLYPCPVAQKRTVLDPTEWIPAESSQSVIRVAVAHGSVREYGVGDPTDNPISLDSVAAKHLDYLALGHWHSTSILTPRAAYSGTPESTSHTERDSGNVLVVSIDQPGSVPHIEQVHVGHLNWVQIEHEMSAPWQDSLLRLRSAVADVAGEPSNSLLRLKLFGASTSEALAGVDDLVDDLRSTFLHIDVDTSGLLAMVGEDKLSEWASTRPLVRAVISDLRRLMGAGAQEEAATTADSEVTGIAGVDGQPVDMAEVINRARLPQDGGFTIGREEVQAALTEMLKALGGISQ